MKIEKDMLIGDLVRALPQSIPVLMSFGMGCVGCPASQMESLEEASMVHGIDLDAMLQKLNEISEEK